MMTYYHHIKKSKEVESISDMSTYSHAVSAYFLEIMAKHSYPAKRLCNKDPYVIKSGTVVAKMFPKAKFIFMIRDGRAMVHSIITRNVTISSYNLSDTENCLKNWNTEVQEIQKQCDELGTEKCLKVYYEQVVLHPEKWAKVILEFLELPWSDNVLHHQDFINKPGGIKLSKFEKSTDQVVKPIYVDALTSWVGFYSEETLAKIPELAPMLKNLGYDPTDPSPSYGQPTKLN